MKIFVGGRVCLFGEHSDWAASYSNFNNKVNPGKALVVGLEQGIEANVKKSNKFIFNLNSDILNIKTTCFEIELEKQLLLKEAKSKSFYSYVASVVYLMIDRYNVEGLHIEIKKVTLPIKKGLSSSAAICILVAQAFNKTYKLNLNDDEIMLIAFEAEILTGSKCGKMDQLCILGQQITEVNFNGSDVNYKKVNVKENIYMLLVDLGGKKDTKKILSDLNGSYPFIKNKIDKKVHKGLGDNNLKILNKAIQAIETGNVKKLGMLMTLAQKNFDKNIAIKSPNELKSPLLHSVLSLPEVKELTFGGKGVGSQGDGSCQLIAKNKDCQKKLKLTLEQLGYTCFELNIYKQNKISKAVIPVAGYGTRLYPYTKIINKEFCPVVSNNMLKPQISILLENLYDCGIKKIGLIISSNKQKSIYKEYFYKKTNYLKSLSNCKNQLEYDNKLRNIYKTIKFIKNKNVDNGFAYSISLAHNFIQDEPVIMCLGDTLYKNTTKNCIQQLIDFYDKHQKSCVGLTLIPLEQVKNYGTFLPLNYNSKELFAKKLYEKPPYEFAEENLVVENNQCLGFFGNYILKPNIFDIMKTQLNKDKSKVQFTECLDIEREINGFAGLIIDGKSLDFGNVESYKNNFSKLN